MLEVRNLTIEKIAEKRTLIQDLSFTLNSNDKFAIIGLEGIGKSTLLKVILDDDNLDYIEIKGEINNKALRIGYLPQNLREIWHDQNVIDFLLKSEIDKSVKPEDYQKLALLDKILNYVKFDLKSFDDNKIIAQFSGGEIVKLGLTKILLKEPDILLLDEPTNDLDLETILFLEDFIINESKPILFISHDEALLENTANGIIHLVNTHKTTKALSFFEKSTYSEYKNSRRLSLDTQEMIARKQRSDFNKKMERFRQVYQKVEYLQNQAVRAPTQGRLLKKKIHSLKSTEARYLRDKENFLDVPEREEEINLFFNDAIVLPKNKVILNYINETISIGNKLLASNIDLSVKGPERIAIIGKNGVGKSTFIKKILADLQNNSTIKVGYMSQDYDELLLADKTVIDSVLDRTDRDYENKVRTMLGSLNFTGEEMVYTVSNLSGGQKAKLLLLKLVLAEANVLLLDEPTRNLSPLSIPTIHQMLIDYKGCIICITHDRNFIENVFDKVYILNENGLELL